jgi:hypothetical protein
MANDLAKSRRATTVEVLAFLGFDARDFQVEEEIDPLLGDTLLPNDLLAIRRLSTGDERVYVAGEDDRSWLANVLNDLMTGAFGSKPVLL